MSTEFAQFADAMAKPARTPAAPALQVGRVAILGGGPDARMLAAIALSEGAEVTLFSAYGAELEMLKSGGIALRGDGPVGSYQVNADNAPSVRTTAELDVAVKTAEVIFLTGPVHKQRTYAMVLADHLSDGQVLVIAPARTFGALETRWMLGIGGCRADITIVEADLPYWFNAEGNTLHLSTTTPGGVATLPGGRRNIAEALFGPSPSLALLPNTTDAIAASVRHTAFADGSGLVEVPALVMGGPGVPAGGPAIPLGGVPLDENQTFRHLIGPQHMSVIDALAIERRNTAQLFGIRDLPDTETWLDRHAGAASGDGVRGVPDMGAAQAIIRDAVIGSLVPLTSAARLAGVDTPATDAMISLASALLGADLASAGRKLPAMGIDGVDLDTARRAMETATGAS